MEGTYRGKPQRSPYELGPKRYREKRPEPPAQEEMPREFPKPKAEDAEQSVNFIARRPPGIITTPTIFGAKPAPKEPSPAIKIMSSENSKGPVVGPAATGPFPQQPTSRESKKLFTANFDMQIDQVQKLLSEQTDFTVIGVLGREGVGKSTIMSELCGYGRQNDEVGTLPFPVQSEESILDCRHETIGVDLCVSPDHLILLDTQPILSSSVLSDLIRSDAPHSSDVVSHENLHELQSIQLGVFLLSVCHLLIVVQDFAGDLELWRFLRTLDMLKFRIPDVSLPVNMPPPSAETHNDKAQWCPQVVFVLNKLPEEDFEEGRRQQIQSAVHCFLQGTKISGAGRDDAASPMPVFMLPYNSSPNSMSAYHQGYQVLLDRCRNALLGSPRRPFARPVSERDWLRNASRVWDLVRKSSFIADYSKTLQKMHLYGT